MRNKRAHVIYLFIQVSQTAWWYRLLLHCSRRPIPDSCYETQYHGAAYTSEAYFLRLPRVRTTLSSRFAALFLFFLFLLAFFCRLVRAACPFAIFLPKVLLDPLPPLLPPLLPPPWVFSSPSAADPSTPTLEVENSTAGRFPRLPRLLPAGRQLFGEHSGNIRWTFGGHSVNIQW